MNETQFHPRANMVSFEKVFHLYDFVVDVHGKNYYHDCNCQLLYNTVQISRWQFGCISIYLSHEIDTKLFLSL